MVSVVKEKEFEGNEGCVMRTGQGGDLPDLTVDFHTLTVVLIHLL